MRICLALSSCFFVVTITTSASARQLADVDRVVERCSVVENAGGLAGPAALQVQVDANDRIVALEVLTPRLVDTDFSRCVRRDLVVRDGEGAAKARLRVAAFHPWATRQRRTFAAVRRHLKRRGFTAAFKRCLAQHPEDYHDVDFTIDPAGEAHLHLGLPGWRSGPPDERERVGFLECMLPQIRSLAFERAGQYFAVSIDDEGRRPTLKGATAFPWPCSVEGYPCTEAAQQAVEEDYLAGWEERVDCSNIDAALEWLREQPAIDHVSYGCKCFVRFNIKGPRWSTIDWTPDEPESRFDSITWFSSPSGYECPP